MADIRTILSIFSEKDNIDLEIVKQLIPITPSAYWKKGDPVKADNMLHRKESCWEIEFDKKTIDLQTCIVELSKFIDTYTEELKQLHFEYGFKIYIQFIITIHSYTSPIISMQEDFLGKLANIGGSFYIALSYDDEEDDSPDAWDPNAWENDTGLG